MWDHVKWGHYDFIHHAIGDGWKESRKSSNEPNCHHDQNYGELTTRSSPISSHCFIRIDSMP